MYQKHLILLRILLLNFISVHAQNNFIATPPGYTIFAPRIASNNFIYCSGKDGTDNYAIFDVNPVTKTKNLFPSDTVLGGVGLLNFMTAGNYIYFSGRFGLFRIDPSNKNVKRVASFAGASGVHLFAFSNKVFFTNTSSKAFIYDPQTALIDTLKYNGVPVNPGTYPQVIVYNGALYFLGQGTDAQSSLAFLYRYDGLGSNLARSNNSVAGSTFMLSQSAYAAYSTLFTPIALNNRVVFFLMDDIIPKHLAAFDVTNFNNPNRVNLWSFGINFNHLTLFNNKLYFRDNDKIFSTDGLNAAELASDIPMTGFGSLPNNAFAVVNDKLLGSHYDNNGTELWASDGTSSGTHLLYNLFEGTYFNVSNVELPLSGNPQSGVVYNDNLYFLAEGSGTLDDHSGEYMSSYYVWKTNGTAEGTVKYSSVECSEIMTTGAYSQTDLAAAVQGKVNSDVGTFTLKPIWFTSANGAWEAASNWSSNTVPAPMDDVFVNNGTLNINSTVTVRSLTAVSPAIVQVSPGAQVIIAR